jgi:hypothetical protein
MKYYVYVISADSMINGVKIGFTKNLNERLGALQTGHPERLVIAYRKAVSTLAEARELEALAHKRLTPYRLIGEWFDVSVDTAQYLIENIALAEGMDEDLRQQRIAEMKEHIVALDEARAWLLAEHENMKKNVDRCALRLRDNMDAWSAAKEELVRLEI